MNGFFVWTERTRAAYSPSTTGSRQDLKGPIQMQWRRNRPMNELSVSRDC